MDSPKIALVGAGSVEFTRNLLADILAFRDLRSVSIALHDIDPGRLATAEAIARSMNETLGAGATIQADLDRRAALDGAAFVVNEIQVGGYASTLIDFDIPRRYGVRQTIGDTIGVGGIFRGLRTIPVLLDICRDMSEVCPDAWLVNYTNPMAMIGQAVGEAAPGIRFAGLCHSVRDTHALLAGLVGLDHEMVDFLTAGYNHQAFVIRFEHDGEDLYPRLDEVIARTPGMERRFRVELYRRFGYFPTESSEHSAEYVPWVMRHDSQVDRFRTPLDEYLRRCVENLAEYEEIERRLASGEGFEVEPTNELASLFIHSVETGTDREIYGTVPNRGLIENLPAGSGVEVPMDVGADGARPRAIGRVPAQCAALNRTFANVCDLTVRAVLDQDREQVYRAAMLDPNAGATLTLAQIRAMCDELLLAHEEMLPAALRRR